MTAPNYDYVYQPGGSLGFRAPSYVPRQADDDLYEGIKSGRFCYVFNCRQMGKSSLRVRVSKRLEQDGYRCAALDLTAVGGDEHLMPAQWYRSLITELNRSLSLLSVAEFDAWLAASDGLTAVYALSQFIEDVVLAKTTEQPVVIFIDEIDNVLSLSFDTNDLFAVIRNCYNKRADNPDYARLNFSLFGVATPAKLMRDTSRTPFNIGKAIRLTPLDLAQAKPLENGMVGWVEAPEQVLKAIFEWTGGQPYLTQRLCELVQDEGMVHGEIVAAKTVEKVADLVEQHILSNWQLQDEQNHLKTIQDRMLRQSGLTNRVVALYGQVLKEGEITAESNDEATVELRLSGVVVQEEQNLRSFNRIYQCVFSSDWAMKTLADLRPYSTMFEVWVASGSKDRGHLLRGKMLKDAESWAEGKSLSDLDNRYLRESQIVENKTFKKWAQVSTLVSGLVAAGMLAAAGISYKAYVDVEKKVIASQLKVIANDSKNSLLEGKTIDALTTAVRGGEIVKEQSLQSTQEGALVLATLSQARHPNSTSNNAQGPYSYREHNRLSGHSGGVFSVSFSPDGETLASAGEDGTVKLWTRAGELIETLSGHSGRVYSVGFSPDGKTLASASGDGTVKLWTRTGELIETLSGHSSIEVLSDQSGEGISVSFSPDGETLASASGDGTVKLWTRTGELIETLSERSMVKTLSGFLRKEGISVSFSPDGETLASASGDGTVKLWTRAGELIETLSGHSGRVYSVRFSTDGKTLASASGDGTVKLWTRAGELIETLSGHSGGVYSVRFSPDGETLASASRDGTVKLWTRAGELIETLSGHSGRVYSVGFSPDGKTLASASGDGTVKLWTRAGELIKPLSGHSGRVFSVSFSSDGETLASAGGNGTMTLWTRTGELIETLSSHSSGEVYSVSFSPDGETLASAGGDGTVKLWTRAGELIETLSGHSGGVFSVRFSPDGETLASASRDGTVKLWTRAGELIKTLSGHSSGEVYSVSFSPDGETLASAGGDGTVKLWTRVGELIETLSGHSSGEVYSVSFSPDGETLASASRDGTVKLWTRAGELIETLSGHSDGVYSVSFSPDGETLASAGGDGTVKLWTRTGELIEKVSISSGAVYSVSFSPDGETLASAGGDGTVKLWTRNLESLLTGSCNWLAPYLRNNSEGQQAAKEGVCEEYLKSAL